MLYRMLLTRRLLRFSPASRLGVASAQLSHRHQFSSRVPEQWQADDYNPIGQEYTKHTLWTLDFFARLVKYSALSIAVLGATTWTAYEATHMYVEHVSLASEKDEEVKKWQWDEEREKWSGGSGGGTDRALGFKGAHAVRGAWIAQNWGIGSEGNAIMSSKAFTGAANQTGALNVVEARLEFAQDFLSVALQSAISRGDRVQPGTITALMTRHASILERMGSPDALFEARAELERVWHALASDVGINERARLALKLGDLNGRLGDKEDALTWWATTLQLLNSGSTSNPTAAILPTTVPTSPLAQRTLAATLVSLSAHYSTSGQLQEAQSLQERAIDLIRSAQPSTPLSAATRPEALHYLYLLHRSSLLSIHHAEVLYALRSPSSASISWLRRAAESSERVALAMSGLPFVHPDAPGSRIPHPPSSEESVITEYAKSLSMQKPATSLLRDARRSAAEAWNLIGLLTEGDTKQGGVVKALECYERALGWAGVSADRVGNIGEAGEGVLEAEWKVLWANYVRAREMLRKKP